LLLNKNIKGTTISLDMSYKQFRVTSDGFRKSVREEMSLKFERDEELFLKILKEKGYPSRGSQITRES